MKLRLACAALAAALTTPFAANAACPPSAKCIGSVGRPEAVKTAQDGARWLMAPEPVAYVRPAVALPDPEPIEATEIVEIGDRIERGEYNMVIGSDYYGLPRPPEGAVYYNVADRVLVVDRETMQVLDDATDMAIRGF